MTDTTQPPVVSNINVQALDALIVRLQEAIDYNLALSTDDIRLVLNAILTLASMQERLSDQDITVHKLRKLLGMVKSSEKLSDLLTDVPDSRTQKRKVTRTRKPKKKPTVQPEKVFHSLVDLKKGARCPQCERGTLYKYEPAQLLRITGHSPYRPVLHVFERLRCNACGQFVSAELPEAVRRDGHREQKYGYSARTLMALNKYFAGTPFFRQESLQTILGFAIAASTVFDQCEYLANDLQPLFQALKRLAGDAQQFELDDTTHRILKQKPIEKKKRRSEKTQIRTGIYASGIIATRDERPLVLFQTNIGHAGEFIDEILVHRQPDKPPPILMSDALSSNNPTVRQTYQAACNAHARRQFVDVLAAFPQDVEWVLQRYQMIWTHDDKTVEQKMTATQRLDYHREHSLPVMDDIYRWCEQQLTDEIVEENSGLGKAMAYFIRHFERLSLFCHKAGAKIDNNDMESMLKLIVRNRKNAYFYQTAAGAAISDVITSCIATAMQNEINVFDYFNAIQRNRQAVKENPLDWLPWNYPQSA